VNPVVDVAISGSGIGGVVLALSLARAGLSVTLVEQAKQFAPIYRGEFLQPRSLEILYDLGLQAEIEDCTVPVSETRMRNEKGQILAVVDYSQLDHPIREGRNGHHRDIQGVVLAALEREPLVTLLMGTRVLGLLRDANGGVDGLETSAGPVRARLTVGADGQYSAVRKAMGVTYREFRYPGEALAVTVDLEAPEPKSVEFVFGAGQSGLLFPLPKGHARLYLVISDKAYSTMRAHEDRGLADMQTRLTRLMPEYAEAIGRIGSMTQVQRTPCFYLRADRWYGDGVALLGDAVHSVSPTRGQGMNLSIQDAAALANLMAALPRAGRVLAADLAPYQAVRQRQADFIQRDADRTHRFLFWDGTIPLWLRNRFLGVPMRAPRTMAVILGMYAGLVRPPVWYDHLFVSLAVAIPPLDTTVARFWGGGLKR